MPITKRSYRRTRSNRRISRRVRSKRNRRNKSRPSRSYSTRRNKRSKRAIHRGGDIDDLTLAVQTMERSIMPNIQAKYITRAQLSTDDIKDITKFFRFIKGERGTSVDMRGRTLTKSSCTKFFGRGDCEADKNENYNKALGIFNTLAKKFPVIMTQVATDLNFNNPDALRKNIESKITKRNQIVKQPEMMPLELGDPDIDTELNVDGLPDMDKYSGFVDESDEPQDVDYTYEGPPEQ